MSIDENPQCRTGDLYAVLQVTPESYTGIAPFVHSFVLRLVTPSPNDEWEWTNGLIGIGVERIDFLYQVGDDTIHAGWNWWEPTNNWQIGAEPADFPIGDFPKDVARQSWNYALFNVADAQLLQLYRV